MVDSTVKCTSLQRLFIQPSNALSPKSTINLKFSEKYPKTRHSLVFSYDFSLSNATTNELFSHFLFIIILIIYLTFLPFSFYYLNLSSYLFSDHFLPLYFLLMIWFGCICILQMELLIVNNVISALFMDSYSNLHILPNVLTSPQPLTAFFHTNLHFHLHPIYQLICIWRMVIDFMFKFIWKPFLGHNFSPLFVNFLNSIL